MTAQPDVARITDLLARLVAIDTQNPPGGEMPAASLLADALRDAGFATELRALPGGRANVLARLDNGPGPVLAFNSHLDTVPVGEGWSTDPLHLVERDGRLYGRGACDAKGQVSAMAEAGRLLLDARQDWRGTLLLAFVADEEVGGIGARTIGRDGPRIDWVVVGEPTGNAVCAGHKGCVRPLLRVAGRAAHSSTPERGVNAILAAGRLLPLLAEHDAMLRRRTHPLLGPASLTVTRIAGGIADNIVPDGCEIVLDRRLLPGETPEAALAEIEAVLDRARREQAVNAALVRVRTAAGAAVTPDGSPLLAAALEASPRHGVTAAQPIGFTGGSDLVHFCDAGATGLLLGPGSLAVAHQPDEFVPRDELVQAALIYRDIALAMLRPDAPGAPPDQ